jgi:hypothetical protein
VADSYFGAAYVDADEWRDTPTRHRYVHGGFQGTDTRFTFYFCPEEQYRGRFFQWLEGGPGGHEDTAALMLGFPFAQGGYVVESNQGHIGVDPGPPDPAITNWRASEESARYAKELAAEMYGAAPAHGYMWGGSGGGIRTIRGLENVDDVWSGGVPFVPPFVIDKPEVPAGTQNLGSLQSDLIRALGPKLTDVIDALEPGGGGDPFAGLDDEQSDLLRQLFELGYPRGALFLHDRPSVETLLRPMGIQMMRMSDPTWLDDYWTKPGYGGADGELADLLIDTKATITRLVPSEELREGGMMDPALEFAKNVAPSMELTPVGFVLDVAITGDARYAAITMLSGEAAGHQLTCYRISGDVLVVSVPGAALSETIAVGDELTISNRDWLAFSQYHRYEAERGDSQTGISMFGNPLAGEFAGKMIIVNSALDSILPTAPTGYVGLAHDHDHDGNDADDRLRLWWTDNAAHVPGMAMAPGPAPVAGTRLVNYLGINEQAMLDLIEWVEHDTAPAPSTAYEIVDGQLRLAPTAAERRGIQPVVSATANGAVRADVAVGEAVTFAFTAELPPDVGTIIAAQWDFDGEGTFPERQGGIDGSQTSVDGETTHVFDAPGTYFPCVRVESHRDGDVQARFARVENLARVRVVVS